MTKATQLSDATDFAHRCQQAYRRALDIAELQTDWLVYFREVLGVSGIVRKLFGDDEERARFEQTVEHAAIQEMLVQLRQKSPHIRSSTEPTRVVTVRVPRCVHEALQREASDRQTSINQLCVSKLLRALEQPPESPE